MYRFRVPDIFLGCFLTIAVFAAGMLFKRDEQPSSPAQAVEEHETSGERSKPESPDSELTGSTWLTKDAAGFFTFGLMVVGIGQALLFYFQLRYMLIGMRDATVAAQAAKLSAEAAIKSAYVSERALTELERPWLFAFGIKVVPINQLGEWTVEFTVANFGKMPAIIEHARLGFVISDCAEPSIPLFAGDDHDLVVSPILQAGERRIIKEAFPNVEDGSVSFRVLQSHSGEILESTPAYEPPPNFDSFFRIVINYRGPNTKAHESCALWLYQPPFDFLNRGGEEYNYTK